MPASQTGFTEQAAFVENSFTEQGTLVENRSACAIPAVTICYSGRYRAAKQDEVISSY
jgi:hypothetical protein